MKGLFYVIVSIYGEYTYEHVQIDNNKINITCNIGKIIYLLHTKPSAIKTEYIIINKIVEIFHIIVSNIVLVGFKTMLYTLCSVVLLYFFNRVVFNYSVKGTLISGVILW